MTDSRGLAREMVRNRVDRLTVLWSTVLRTRPPLHACDGKWPNDNANGVRSPGIEGKSIRLHPRVPSNFGVNWLRS